MKGGMRKEGLEKLGETKRMKQIGKWEDTVDIRNSAVETYLTF